MAKDSGPVTQTADTIRAAMRARGMSENELAEKAGIAQRTLNRRMKNPDDFTMRELIAITEVLGLDFAAVA